MQKILEVLVGSQAHGLSTPESDHDYMGVFILPTRQSHSLFATKTESYTENNCTWFEVGKFMKMALTCNPTALEVLKAPIERVWSLESIYLRDLFPHFLTKKRILGAYLGYAKDQRNRANKRMFTPDWNNKPLAHYIRVLFNGIELLKSGNLTVNLGNKYTIGTYLKQIKAGELNFEEIIQIGETLEQDLKESYEESTLPEVISEESKLRLDDYLLNLRKNYW